MKASGLLESLCWVHPCDYSSGLRLPSGHVLCVSWSLGFAQFTMMKA